MPPRAKSKEDLEQEKQQLIDRRAYLNSLQPTEAVLVEKRTITSRLGRINTYLDPSRHDESKEKDRIRKTNTGNKMVSWLYLL